MIGLRHRKRTIQVVKKFDAFPKTSEECIEKKFSGGTCKCSYNFCLCIVSIIRDMDRVILGGLRIPKKLM